MGYSCPVCGDPQADDVHLANHLAFTAMVRGGDHEAWLDEHVPDWAERGEDELAGAVTDLADETEYPQVFEDTTAEGDHAPEGSPDPLPGGAEPASQPELDDDAREILAEAREMTRQRRSHDSEGDDQRDEDADGQCDADVDDRRDEGGDRHHGADEAGDGTET